MTDAVTTAGEVIDLHATGAGLLDEARVAPAHRAAKTIVGGAGATLRQTLLALHGEASLGEHEAPGAASLYVVTGRVRLHTEARGWELHAGQFMPLPQARHWLDAVEDSVVLLSVAAG